MALPRALTVFQGADREQLSQSHLCTKVPHPTAPELASLKTSSVNGIPGRYTTTLSFGNLLLVEWSVFCTELILVTFTDSVATGSSGLICRNV